MDGISRPEGTLPLYISAGKYEIPFWIFPQIIELKTNGSACATAFNGTTSAGVHSPWRFGNLNNGGNAGLACENGNNSPGNANWNGRPRISQQNN